MADILTLSEYKAYAGIAPTNVRNDDKYNSLLPAVGMAILNHTGRDFTTSLVTEDRTFEYDNSGVLDIDDATTINTVTINNPWGAAPLVLGNDEWFAQPPRRDDSPVYWYLSLPGFVISPSPEMGFTWNADVAFNEGRWRSKPSTITVNAVWGWAVVPQDVKMAAKWTLDDWVARRPETAAPAEAIESYSRTWGGTGRMGEALSLAIPYRARDLLAGYTKVNV
jgi:hypothetical protein